MPLVLCEGKEDMLILKEVPNAAGLGDKLRFDQYEGSGKLHPFLANLKVSPEYVRGEYSRILLTCDADSDYAEAWKFLTKAISKTFSCELQEPLALAEQENGPALSAAVISGSDKTGMIETLCMDSSRKQTEGLFECLDPLMDCLENRQGSKPHEKVRFAIWTIIAQGNEARKRLSVERAISHIPINWNCTTFAPLLTMLKSVI
jgi:hypothetical protein